MSGRKKVLWLVSWYPNKYDPFDGDFIQRHARAAALYDDIHVLFIKAFDAQAEKEQEWKEEAGLTEQIIYLPKTNGLLGKVASFLHWQRQYKSAVTLIIKNHHPQLIHVHIPWKAGIIALWAKRKFKISFLVTEHWGIYNKVVEDNIYTKSFPVRFLLKKIYKEADAFVSVSRYLGEGVNSSLVRKEFTVIPNAVDTNLFFPSEKKYKGFTFLHVSNMVPLKNVGGVIQAFHQFLLQTNANAQLVMVGNRDNQYQLLAERLGLLHTSVFFRGEIRYAEVAGEMQRSHVLILNSNIENSPCVIGEALCCGLPVIATNVGGIPELINETNGILIPPGDEKELANAMIKVYQSHGQSWTEGSLSPARNQFSPHAIGKQFTELYARAAVC